MFSQQGTDSSEVFSDNYEDFDGNPVNGNFIPNIAINFKTGATYQRNSYIYGSVIKITKQITFTGNFTVTDIKNGSFYEINAQSAGAILLSRDNIENGCEIEFLITQWNSVIGENTVYISSKAKYTESSESGLVNSIGYEKSIDAVNTGVATITGGLLTVAHLKKSGAYAKFRYSDTLDTWCLIS